MNITITRDRLYPAASRPGPAWRWTYGYAIDGAAPVGYGTGLASLRSALRKFHPAAIVTCAWDGAR